MEKIKLINTVNTYATRPFNIIVDNGKTLTKKSLDKNKIDREYAFYHLLSNKIQRFLVEPTRLSFDGQYAEYTMKKINGPNAGELYSIGMMTISDFSLLINTVLDFKAQCLKTYGVRSCSENDSISLVVYKTKQRIGSDTENNKLLDRVEKAFQFYKHERRSWNMVVSHGDLCLSNMMLDIKEGEFKFIDPRGASTSDELYMDEYYDLAKLSQSILGKYEGIVYGVSVDNEFGEEVFVNFLRDQDISLNLLRVYEASLFLSMIPLHHNKPANVAQFLDKCKHILSEIGF